MVQTWTLTDADASSDAPQWQPDAESLGGFQLERRRLRGGLSEGVETIRLSNGRLTLVVVPTRGMGIWRAECDGIPLGWGSPVHGPVHPAFVSLSEPSGIGWLDGFDELLVRCGLESNGAPEFSAEGRLVYPLHGRIANRPAHRLTVDLDADAGELVLTGVVDEGRLMGSKLRLTSRIRLKRDANQWQIEDRVENLSAEPSACQMLYHTNLGAPLLDAGATFVAPVKAVVPRNARSAQGMADWDRFAGPQAGFEEQAYFLELLADAEGRATVLLKNPPGTQAVSLVIRADTLPCFTLWKYTAAEADGYVMGLEPGTNFPNPRTFEARHQRIVPLPPGGSVDFEFGVCVHATRASVMAQEERIAQLQASHAAEYFSDPQPDWCADM